MPRVIPPLLSLLLVTACGPGTPADSKASAGAAAPGPKVITTSALVGADAKSRCGGFTAAQAAEILGVAASTVTERSQDITPTSRGCEFVAGGDRRVSFSLSVDKSSEDTKRDFESLRETYTISARAQESAGKKLEQGAYSEILDVGDEAVWSVTNGALSVRHNNVTIMVMAPSDKRTQVAVAKKILERL